MWKYVKGIEDYFIYKVLAGIWASFWSDELPQLFLIFVFLEIMDIFTRWLALTADWYKKVYPQSEGNLYIYLKWMWQARKWRWIKSTGLRDGFCDKMLVYLILLLVAALVDGALIIGHVPPVMRMVTTMVLATTEALSICENLGEAGVSVVKEIEKKIKEKVK